MNGFSVDLDRIIASAVKSGKMFFGSKKALDAAKSGKAVALILASNCPPESLADIRRHSALSKIPLYVHSSTSSELGAACGKPFAVSALTIREISDPDVLRMIRESRDASEVRSKQ